MLSLTTVQTPCNTYTMRTHAPSRGDTRRMELLQRDSQRNDSVSLSQCNVQQGLRIFGIEFVKKCIVQQGQRGIWIKFGC